MDNTTKTYLTVDTVLVCHSVYALAATAIEYQQNNYYNIIEIIYFNVYVRNFNSSPCVYRVSL